MNGINNVSGAVAAEGSLEDSENGRFVQTVEDYLVGNHLSRLVKVRVPEDGRGKAEQGKYRSSGDRIQDKTNWEQVQDDLVVKNIKILDD